MDSSFRLGIIGYCSQGAGTSTFACSVVRHFLDRTLQYAGCLTAAETTQNISIQFTFSATHIPGVNNIVAKMLSDLNLPLTHFLCPPACTAQSPTRASQPIPDQPSK